MSKIVLIENIKQLNYLLGLKSQVDCYNVNKGKNETISIWCKRKDEYIVHKHIVDSNVEKSEDTNESEITLTEKELFDISKTIVGSLMNSKNLVLYSYMLDGIDFVKYNNFKNKGK